MAVVKQLKRGDACPACGGELRAAAVPTDDQFRKAFDKENPISLPPGTDTASPDQRAALGELSVCQRCGYQTRFPHEHTDADSASSAEANGGKQTGGQRAG